MGIQSTKTTVIDPLSPQERDIMSVYDLIYESLVVIGDNYTPEPGIAESWDVSGNSRTWTFHLRKDVTFSDGTPLTASDVAATLKYILERANDESSSDKGYYQNLRYFVDSVTVKDERTVVIKAKSDRAYWGFLFAMTFPVLPQARLSEDNPPGSGPYRIEKFSAGNYISLSVNPYWWQHAPQVKEITVLCHETPSAVVEAYEYARVDAIFTRTIAAAQYKSGTSSLAINYRTNQLETLLMNHSYGILKDVNVRKAIRYAIDADQIATTAYMGMVDRTNTPFINGTWMYNSSVDSACVRNVASARKLLEDAGWGDSNEDGFYDRVEDNKLVHLKLDLYVYEEPDNNVRYDAASIIQSSLAEAGIDVSITTMKFSDLQFKLDKGAFHLALVSYAMDPCPDYGFMLISGNTGNYCRYRSTQMTQLCRELRACQDQGSFQSKLFEIQQQFVDDCPFICLYYRCGAVLTRRMYTTARDVRELELLRGIETFKN
ncbi:MAG: ABC transporter substrate-binding protein [bacterium]|nr:ABC transporter substrate-binding protein [bacterium]